MTRLLSVLIERLGRSCFSYALSTAVVLTLPVATLCQTNITPDGSLGTTVNQVGNVFNIDGGKIMRTHQFQSFDNFSLGSGDIASFNGPAGVENILSRVTGGELSNINGTMRSTINGANLYFFNPSGVVLGPDAKLNVTGSFHASTADFIQFMDGARFFADLSRDSILSAAAPEAFGFLSEAPANISLEQSFLEVPAGETLSVIGGDISLTGATLKAPGSRVNIASAAAPGEVIPSGSDLNVTSEDRGRIQISGGANINASGAPFPAKGAGGTVIIRGGELLVAGVPESSEPTVVSDTPGPQHGAQIGIDIKMTGETNITGGARLRSASLDFSKGNAGAIVLDVGHLKITDSSSIESSTFALSTGKAGDVTITATEEVSIIDSNIRSQSIASFADGGSISITAPLVTLQGGLGNTINSSTTFLSGNGGDIVLNVDRLEITEDAGIISRTADGSGSAGNILVRAAKELAISSEASFFASALTTRNERSRGTAGNITIDTQRLSLTSGGQIDSSTQGEGNAGNVEIFASEEVLIAGLNKGSQRSVISSTNRGGAGDAGNIVIRTENFTVTDFGRVESSTAGTGKGGAIVIENLDGTGIPANYILISAFTKIQDAGAPAGNSISRPETGLFTETAGAGDGGEIKLSANNVVLSHDGTISAKAIGTGDAGDLTIRARRFKSNDSSISTAAEMSDGGNIEVTADSVMDLFRTSITAEAMGDTQAGSDGGNVAIRGDSIALNRSSILANAFGGNGGNIDVAANVFLASTESILDASSKLGIDGEVNVDAGVRVLTGTLAPLSDVFLGGVDLLRGRCAGRYREGHASSFILSGRDRVPLQPRDPLPSRHYQNATIRVGFETRNPLNAFATSSRGLLTHSIFTPAQALGLKCR